MIGLLFISGCVIVVLLFLYITLRYDVKQLRKQVEYANQEQSQFLFYTTSTDKNMQALIVACNEMRNTYHQECVQYHQMDQDFKDLITNISHDIRTPLTSINGYIQLLEECENKADQERYYRILHQRLDYLKELLEELFLYTKLVNRKIAFQIEPVCLYDVLCETLVQFHTQFVNQQMELSLTIANERAMAECDSIYLRRILNNLCMNVVRHGKNQLSIHQDIVQEQVVLSFANEVVNEEIDVDSLFQRFYTGDISRNNQNSGLGLAIVKELVDSMDGSVVAQMKQHRLIITLTFPLHPKHRTIEEM